MNYSELLQLAKGWGNSVYDRFNIWRLRYGELPYVITKEEEPVLVYFGYAAYEEEGYYEIYVLSGKYADDHLWNGPVAKGEVALREGSKTIEVDARNKEKYQVTISVTEDGKSEIKIEQIS